MVHEPFQKGVDPREYFRYRHREHGPREFTYTYNDLARILGVKVESARNMASRGLFKPGDLDSFVALCVVRALKKKPTE